jgi:hypothetical protein
VLLNNKETLRRAPTFHPPSRNRLPASRAVIGLHTPSRHWLAGKSYGRPAPSRRSVPYPNTRRLRSNPKQQLDGAAIAVSPPRDSPQLTRLDHRHVRRALSSAINQLRGSKHAHHVWRRPIAAHARLPLVVCLQVPARLCAGPDHEPVHGIADLLEPVPHPPAHL